MTAGGCFAAPTYYSGEYNLGTGTMHHHSAAQALFAGFRTRICPAPASAYFGARSLRHHSRLRPTTWAFEQLLFAITVRCSTFGRA